MTATSNSQLRWLEALIGVILVGIVGGELFIYSPPGQRAARSLGVAVQSATIRSESTSVMLEITHGVSDTALRLAAFPIGARASRQPAIFVFDDAGYATANASPTTAETVLYHLAGELTIRHYPSSIEGVTADGLREVFRNTPDASKRTVVMASGVMPSIVFSRGVDLVTPWVDAGGLIVWGGGTIGYWSADAGRPLSASAGQSLREKGTDQLLGVGVVRYPSVTGRAADLQSDFASALGVSYKPTGAGVLRDSVVARGGLLLGWYSTLFSSVSYLPHGQGGYLIFGGEIQDGESVSLDLAQILLAGATSAAGPVATKAISLSDSAAKSTFVWDLPFPMPAGGIAVVAFDPNRDGSFYFRRLVTN